MNKVLTEKYQIEETQADDNWDSFVDQSPQGTVFSMSCYLKALSKKYSLCYIKKGNEIKAAIVIIINDDNQCILDDLVIYNGILFKEDHTQKPVKAIQEQFEISEFIINYLDKKYNRIELALSPHYTDMRPFLWHNYHSDDPKEKFTPDLRYTSYINISELAENKDETETRNFKNLETLRQRNIREARKKNAQVSLGDDTGLFIYFYEKLMEAQGSKPDELTLKTMENIIVSLLEDKKALLFYVKNSNKDILYITVFNFDSKRAYFLFGAGNPKLRDRYEGTLAFWDAFKILAKDYKVKEIDMEGINSPQRGWFKLSFGGSVLPYFKVFKKNNNLSYNFIE